jgi:hypothetical protein
MIDEVPTFLPGRTDPFHGPGLPVDESKLFSSYPGGQVVPAASQCRAAPVVVARARRVGDGGSGHAIFPLGVQGVKRPQAQIRRQSSLMMLPSRPAERR